MKAFRLLSSGRVLKTLREAREALEECKGEWGGAIERVHISQGKVVGFCVIEINGRPRMTVKEADQIIDRIRREGRPKLHTEFVHRDTRERFTTMRDALIACRGRGFIYMAAYSDYEIEFYGYVPMMIAGKVIRTVKEADEFMNEQYNVFLERKGKIETT